MINYEKVITLYNFTNASLNKCKDAIEYKESHSNVTAIGYIKATSYAVKTNCSFYDRVKSFSNTAEDIL